MGNHILIVDDNPLEADFLSNRLEKDGYTVSSVSSGTAGLEHLDQKLVELLILDLDMPQMNGLEVLAEVRRRGDFPRLPVLMLSASLETASKVEALELGADDFLSKPVEYPYLKAKLRQLMNGRCEPDQLSPGHRFAHYQIEAVLGQGGMGRVLQARDTRLDRLVALKVLLQPSHASVQRFLREARAVSRVQHPNLPAIYEVCETPFPFLSMELVQGTVLTPQSLPVDEVLKLLALTADTLEIVHQHGILHRDIKPSNIMRTPSGGIKVLDFGLAKLNELDDHLTQTGEVFGTPHYMAPECFDPRLGAVDGQSDVYALTVTLYHLLSGRLPFAAPNLGGVIQQVLFQEPQPLGEEFPEELNRICQLGMAKDKTQRFASAAALALALRNVG